MRSTALPVLSISRRGNIALKMEGGSTCEQRRLHDISKIESLGDLRTKAFQLRERGMRALGTDSGNCLRVERYTTDIPGENEQVKEGADSPRR